MSRPDSSTWASWPEPKREQFRNQLRAQAARKGKRVYGDTADPGELAQRLDESVVMRDYLRLIHEAFRDVRDGTIDRLIITTPPQVGKTLAVIWFLFWWMTYRPRDPVILASYGADLAAKRGRMVRTLVERYGAPYGLLRTKGQWARNNWETTAGASMKTGGMDTGVTGEPAALMVIDDPHKDRAEADSKDMREKIWDTYSSSLLSRLRPGAPIVMILTRWHPDDLAARVLEQEGAELDGGRWRVVELPALATKPDDPLGRSKGAPLQHPWIEPDDTARALAHWEEKRRTSTVRDWSALYQADPVPAEGALLTDAQVRERRIRLDQLPEPNKIAVAVDPSGGGRDTAGIIGGFRGTDGRMYMTHDETDVMSSDVWPEVACQLAYDIGAGVIVVEHNFGADMAKRVIRTAWENLVREHVVEGPCPEIKMVNAKRGKYLRAEPIAQQIIVGNAWFAGLLLDLESEWTTWQSDSSESPGRIDASVYLAYHLVRVPGAEAVVSTVKDRPKESTGTSRTAQTRIQR